MIETREVKGRIAINPVVYARGNRRKVILKKNAYKLVEALHFSKARFPSDFTKFKSYRVKEGIGFWQTSTDIYYGKIESLYRNCKNNRSFCLLLNAAVRKIESKLIQTRIEPNTAIVRFDQSIIQNEINYFKNKDVALNCSAWGPHVTLVTGSMKELCKFNRMQVKVTLSKSVLSNDHYCWIPVEKHNVPSELVTENNKLHLTIGYKVCLQKTLQRN